MIGTCCGIMSWLVVAYAIEGEISILSTEANPPLLAGNCISIGLSAILVVGISLVFPEGRFNWELLKENITTTEDTVLCGLHCRRVICSSGSVCQSDHELGTCLGLRVHGPLAFYVYSLASL